MVVSANDANTEESRVIVALDFFTADEAFRCVDRLDGVACKLKVGKQLFTSAGPDLVRRLVSRGYDVFLDLKFHDIPNTVAQACKAAADLGVWLTNVHALGGRVMMENAVAAVAETQTKIIAVTLLTSSDQHDMDQIGLQGSPGSAVLRLADLAKESGMYGVVCSASEASTLRNKLGEDFCLVTPGIRPSESNADDQKRTVMPGQAIANGASYLVIGRPITQATEPAAVLDCINQELYQQTL